MEEEVVYTVVSAVCQNGAMFSDWKMGLLVPIRREKRYRHDCNSYHGITLLIVSGKVLARLLLMGIWFQLLKFHRAELSRLSGKPTADRILARHILVEYWRVLTGGCRLPMNSGWYSTQCIMRDSWTFCGSVRFLQECLTWWLTSILGLSAVTSSPPIYEWGRDGFLLHPFSKLAFIGFQVKLLMKVITYHMLATSSSTVLFFLTLLDFM